MRRGGRLVAATALVLAGLGGPAAAAAEDGPDSIAAPPFVVYYWPGTERLAEHLLEHARTTAPRWPALPETVLYGGPPVHIVLAPDEARFVALTGGRTPEWGAGVAIPSRSLVVLPAYASRRGAPHHLTRVLRHELAHIALNRYLEPARPPRWFDEGYARWAAGEWDEEAAWRLRLAFAFGRAPHLDSLALDWPRTEPDARIAYLLATSAVADLVDRGGVLALERFLTRWKEAGDIEPALRRTYGLGLAQFEHAWGKAVRKRYGWTYFLSHSIVFWFLCTFLFLALYWRRRRRDLLRLERLRATEPPDSPAYWMGEDEDERAAGDEDEVGDGGEPDPAWGGEREEDDGR